MASKLKLFVVAMVGFVTIGLAGFFMIQPVQAQTGGLDLDGHCRTHHGSGARAVNVDGTAHGWRCESGGVQHTMNMDSACVEQYGSWSTAHYSEYNDQNSWYCEIPQQNQPPVQEPVVQDPPPAQQSGNTVTAVVTVCSSDHGIRSGPAWISRSSDLSVRMRTGPGLNNSEIRQLESGTRFDIIDGPRCVDGYVWWEIRHNNRTGWIAEGTASESWIVRTVTATVTVTRRDTPQLIDSGPLGSIPLYEDGTMRARIDYRVLITYTQSGSDITVRTITVRYHVDPVASARVFCWAAVTADLQDSRGNSLRSDGWYGWSGWLIFVSPDEEASVDLTPFQSVGSSGVVDVGINFSCFRFISNQQIAEDSRSPLPPEDSTPAFVRERINVP